jgi:hypothetical protein
METAGNGFSGGRERSPALIYHGKYIPSIIYKYFYSDVFVSHTLTLNQIYTGILSKFTAASASGSTYISRADKTGSCISGIGMATCGWDPGKMKL